MAARLRSVLVVALAPVAACLFVPQLTIKVSHTSVLNRCSVCCSLTADTVSKTKEQIAQEPCVVFSRTTCPYCVLAKEQLDAAGARYTTIELDQEPDGAAIKAALVSITGRTSVPAVFAGGQFLGGANDGGGGGVITLARQGKLAPLLRESGALDVRQGISDGDPVAKLFSQVLFPAGQGKKIAWGVMQRDVDPLAVPSEAVRAELRAAAARDLMNIDAVERERRRLAGTAFGALTAAVAAALLALDVGPLARLAIAPPLFLTYGYLASAREGL